MDGGAIWQSSTPLISSCPISRELATTGTSSPRSPGSCEGNIGPVAEIAASGAVGNVGSATAAAPANQLEAAAPSAWRAPTSSLPRIPRCRQSAAGNVARSGPSPSGRAGAWTAYPPGGAFPARRSRSGTGRFRRRIYAGPTFCRALQLRIEQRQRSPATGMRPVGASSSARCRVVSSPPNSCAAYLWVPSRSSRMAS